MSGVKILKVRPVEITESWKVDTGPPDVGLSNTNCKIPVFTMSEEIESKLKDFSRETGNCKKWHSMFWKIKWKNLKLKI